MIPAKREGRTFLDQKRRETQKLFNGETDEIHDNSTLAEQQGYGYGIQFHMEPSTHKNCYDITITLELKNHHARENGLKLLQKLVEYFTPKREFTSPLEDKEKDDKLYLKQRFRVTPQQIKDTYYDHWN